MLFRAYINNFINKVSNYQKMLVENKSEIFYITDNNLVTSISLWAPRISMLFAAGLTIGCHLIYMHYVPELRSTLSDKIENALFQMFFISMIVIANLTTHYNVPKIAQVLQKGINYLFPYQRCDLLISDPIQQKIVFANDKNIQPTTLDFDLAWMKAYIHHYFDNLSNYSNVANELLLKVAVPVIKDKNEVDKIIEKVFVNGNPIIEVKRQELIDDLTSINLIANSKLHLLKLPSKIYYTRNDVAKLAYHAGRQILAEYKHQENILK